MTLLTDELLSWIGQEAFYPAREELGRASIRYFALALGDDNRLYTDDAYARALGYRSVIAPQRLSARPASTHIACPGSTDTLAMNGTCP